jgi:hypothetical protein
MKLPPFSLRTMLITVAMVAAVVGWLRYESQRGWTVDKVERLVKAEVDPNWNLKQFQEWVASKQFGYCPESHFHRRDFLVPRKTHGFVIADMQGSSLGLFRKAGWIEVGFNNSLIGSGYQYEVTWRAYKTVLGKSSGVIARPSTITASTSPRLKSSRPPAH